MLAVSRFAFRVSLHLGKIGKAARCARYLIERYKLCHGALSVAITGRQCPEYRYRARSSPPSWRALFFMSPRRPLLARARARVIRKVQAIAEIVAPALAPTAIPRLESAWECFSVLESETFRGYLVA